MLTGEKWIHKSMDQNQMPFKNGEMIPCIELIQYRGKDLWQVHDGPSSKVINLTGSFIYNNYKKIE